eukprot:630125_1
MDLDLDFNHLYHQRSTPQYPAKKIAKKPKKNQKKRKKIKKKKAAKKWDDSRTNLNSHKLSNRKQLEKKLKAVSKHRHYAKDLVQEQKKKHFEERRLKQEEKEIEYEQQQLIRRKQQLLRKHPVPHLRRAFPQFTAGKSEYHYHTSSDEDDDDDDDDEYHTDESENDYDDNAIADTNKTEMTLHALTEKLSSLENELETMKLINNNNNESMENTIANDSTNATEDDNTHMNDIGNITLDLDGINQTLNAATKIKKATKTLHLKLPSMPSVHVTQPPQLQHNNECTKEPETVATPQDESKSINTALHSLDVPSLLMLLDKLKMYFKEIQNEKNQNEEFRSTLLESVNAQNTQILHLLAQLASQQKEMDQLKETVVSLTAKVDQCEASNRNGMNANSEPKWSNCIPKHNEIALKDIKNVIEETRPDAYKTKQMLQNTNWKSISNVLVPKTDSFECNAAPQQPYTVKKHQRSFLPPRQEQIQRITPPQPIPKPNPNKSKKMLYIKPNNQQKFIAIEPDISSHNNPNNYPMIRVERFHQ